MRVVRRDREAWDALARHNAPWAVVSTAEYEHSWDEDAFFASGISEVDQVLGFLAQHGLSPRSEAALDFGCGLGRLSQALAHRFDRVVGVDISSEMLAQARALDRGGRVEWRLIPDPALLASVDRVDFCLSLIALQHVPGTRRVASYVEALVKLLKPGGIAVIQVPGRVPWRIGYHPARVAARAAPAAFVAVPSLRRYAMQLTAVPEETMQAAVTAAGGVIEHVVNDGRAGSSAITSLSYVVRVP